MRIGSPRERHVAEARVAMTPESVIQLQKLGHDSFAESRAGDKAGFQTMCTARRAHPLSTASAELYAIADVIAKVRPPTVDEIGLPEVTSGVLALNSLGVSD